jgi:ketosteroid isomerase-like protein
MSAICVAGQTATSKASDEIVAMERSWNEKIKTRDVSAMENFLAPGYFLAIGVTGQPIRVVPRAAWLESLPRYMVESYSIDDIKVNVYGKTAVALMMFSQKAAVGKDGQDRSAQFVISDIWIKTGSGWRIAERHSSRPETPK